MKPIRKISEELNKLDIKMSDELKAYPIRKREAKPNYKLGLGIGLAFAAIIALVAILAINFLAPANNITTYYMVDINPSLIIKVKGGVISEAKSLNNDADAMLIDLNLDGKSLDEGIDLIADEAIKEGYINEEGDAIRLSGIDSSKNSLEAVKNSFVASFKTRGYYVGVATNIISLDEDFTSKFDALEKLSYLNKNLDNQNIKDIYQDEYLLSYLYEAVVLNINRLKNNQSLINKIDKKYEEINDSLNNIYKDYFIIKKYNLSVDDKLKPLILEMDNLIDEYFKLTGKMIESKLQLDLEVFNNNIIDYDLLLNITKSLDSFIRWIKEEMDKAIEKITNLLTNLMPEIKESLNYLIEIPNTIDEYISKLEVLTRSRHNIKISINIDSYNEKREALSDSDYSSFIDKIIAEFGSLENYFEKLQNKTIK